MTHTPQASGLILCERVRVEPSPPTFNLDGLFLGRAYATFPVAVPAFHVYAALVDGRGEGLMELACMELESERDIYYHKKWIAFPAPARTYHYVIPVRKLILPGPGRYRLTMSFDKQLIAFRIFDVRKVRP
jgi:hypothetical protein